HTRVLVDEVVSHAFSHGYHSQHTERLAAYWAEALGGPTTYSDQYGDEDPCRADSQRQRAARGDGPAGDRLFRSGAGGCRPGPRRAASARAARLFRVGYYDNDVSLPPLGRGCTRRFAHPDVVLDGRVG